MDRHDLTSLSATESARLVRNREVSSLDLVDASLDRIDSRNGVVNAFITVLHEDARKAAVGADRAVAENLPLGPLHGVPVAVKDLFDFKEGVRNTFGSLPLAEYVAKKTSVHVARLERAGAIIVGKTNTPEFGHKGVTDNLLAGPTRNPFDLSMNAGGSSGGSAAAVADHMVSIAEGTDGGGSVRIPAALCNVVGFKPTFGRIADPVRPNALGGLSPFQHIGPLARTVEDAALLFSVMAGPDPRDPMSLPVTGEDFVGAVTSPIDGLRIAFSANWGDFPVNPDVSEVVASAVSALSSLTPVEHIDINLGRTHDELSALWLRMSGLICVGIFESFDKAGIDLLGDHRSRVSPELVDLVERAGKLSLADARRDQELRTEVFDSIQDVLDRFDVVVTPTVGVAGVPNATDGHTLGPAVVNGQPVDPLIGWCLTHPINFTGHPAISVPAGLTPEGLPVGLQIVGRRFADSQVLAVAAALEGVRPWAQHYPHR
jgi:amidase/aspartyl-tRNA(Asn)/glutamyl-tRNA(Gln) amidotransferase subunit A